MNDLSLINLEKGILVEVGGECGKYNTLPIDKLVTIGQSLQNLVEIIAKVDLESETMIDLKNFKIELSGYFKNSAVPEFVFTPRVLYTTGDGIEEQRKIVNEKLNVLFSVSNGGDYMKLSEMYKTPAQRNPIVEALFNFSHSCGNSPLSIVNKENGGFKEKYKISKFKKEVKDKLTAEINLDVEEPKEDVIAGLIKKTTTGKTVKNRIIETFGSKGVSLSYMPKVIVFNDVKYHLRDPLVCSLEKISDYYTIRHDILDIIGVGVSEEDAENNFAAEFDYIYNRYNELQDNELTDRIRLIKLVLNSLVISKERNGKS